MTVELAIMTLQEAAQTHEIGEWFAYEDKQYKRCKNGAIMDCGSGKFVYGVPTASIVTHDRAVELANQRWHGEAQAGYKRAIEAALKERNESAVLDTIEQARGKGIEIMTSEIALNAGVREDWRIKAHEHALLQSGMDAREAKLASSVPPGGMQLNIGAEAAADMMHTLAALAEKRKLE